MVRHYRSQQKAVTIVPGTIMFDASGKFPSGISHGSSYALGNFDECLGIKVPYQNDHFFGKYCMTKITITPSYKYELKDKIDYEFNDYATFFNISAWSKMLAYKDEPTKASRDEIYYSFCIPSSCSAGDLKERLTILAQNINSQFDQFSLHIEVNQSQCQIKEEYQAPVGDIIFLSVVAACVFIVIIGSIYDLLSRWKIFYAPKAPRKYHDLLMCFSFPNNLGKLFNTDGRNNEGLDCLAGVKAVSLFLVILGHRCMFIFGAPLLNAGFIEKMYSRFEAAAILNGPIIVDTFFLISGFLASYLILSTLKHSTDVIKVILIYVHRFMRITPAYAVVLAFYCTVFVNTGNGPFWPSRIGVESQRCKESWWTNMLYINNYINVDKMCMFQSWYITCDLHYFLLVPFLVLLIKWNEFYGIAATLILTLGSAVTAATLVYISNDNPILLLYTKLLKDPVATTTFRNMYVPSHMRASPYFLGVLTGYIKYKMINVTYRLPKMMNRTGYIIAFIISLGTLHLGFIFYLPQFTGNTLISAVYAGFHHLTFVLGIAWMIISVSSGKGPWIEPILSWKPFIVLSRLNYSAFLCHGAIQMYTVGVLRQPNYGSLFGVFYGTFGDIVSAYLFGFLLTILFESPIICIEKIVFGKSRSKKNPPQIGDSNDRKSKEQTTQKFSQPC